METWELLVARESEARGDAVAVEGRRNRDPVSAIGVEEELSRAVLFAVALVDDRNWHFCPVAGVDHQPRRFVQRRVKAGGYFLHLADFELAAPRVIIVGRGRRDHRGIADAVGVRRKLGIAVKESGVAGLGKGKPNFLEALKHGQII